MSVLDQQIITICQQSRIASGELQNCSSDSINKALLGMAALLQRSRTVLKKENARDVSAALKNKMAPAMVDRLTIKDSTIDSMISGLKVVASLSTPLWQVFDKSRRPNGLTVCKVKVPIGVVGIIYESRPNVTVDSAAICLKSQNAVILRGGSESFYSNVILSRLFAQACKKAGVPQNAIQSIPTTDRAAVSTLLKQSDTVDLIIPRGGESLIRAVVEQSHIPVIKHYKGVCHIYVAGSADIKKAIAISINAKVQRPSVCNAMETLLLDSKLSINTQKKIIESFIAEGVTLFGDTAVQKLNKTVKKATEADWFAEYLDLRLAVKVVKGVEAAISHINHYGSHHTDAIITKSKTEADHFIRLVDSASVMVNTSTRFADGGEYGMGCEIGISTDKLHARGPMGVNDLTTYKWIVQGNGQIRS